jgi:hypothetical protein
MAWQYAVILVIQQSIPRVGKLLVQLVPLFVGYALFGVMAFGYRFPRFGSFPQALSMLFCLWNGQPAKTGPCPRLGLTPPRHLHSCCSVLTCMHVCTCVCVCVAGDSILETVQELGSHFRVLGLLYVATFIVVFIYVIINIVLAMVQQTLMHVHTNNRSRRRIHRMLHGLDTDSGQGALPSTFPPRGLLNCPCLSARSTDPHACGMLCLPARCGCVLPRWGVLCCRRQARGGCLLGAK